MYFKHAKLEFLTFPRYYWRAFGKQNVFTVTLLQEGKTTQHKVQPILAMEGFEYVRKDIISQPHTLSFHDDTAHLYVGSFSGDEAKFRTFIDDTFKTLGQKKTQNLVIDLRNNTGGDDAFSDYLVSYIANEPFKWCSNFSLKTSQLLKLDTKNNRDLSNPYWQSVMNHPDGTKYDYSFELYQPQPKSRRFKGKVYVLINRQSHSQSAVTAAQIQDHGWATVVGEETAEYASLLASQFSYTLPETDIVVKISKGKITRINGSDAKRGVIPDIQIKDFLLDETDEILDGVLEIIDQSHIGQ